MATPLSRRAASSSGVKWSRRRALGLGVDRLVAVAVGQSLGDVGGQGHEADLVENVVNVLVLLAVKVELYEAVALLHQLHHLTRQHPLAEHHAVAEAGTLSRLDQALPGIGRPLAQEQQLNTRFRSALGVTVQAGGYDLGVVDDQDVLRTDVVKDIEKVLVLNCFGFPVQHHEAGVIPFLHGVLGNQLLGQMVEEIRRPQIRCRAVIYNELIAHIRVLSQAHSAPIPHILTANGPFSRAAYIQHLLYRKTRKIATAFEDFFGLFQIWVYRGAGSDLRRLKPFLKEGVKNPKNFQKGIFDIFLKVLGDS